MNTTSQHQISDGQPGAGSFRQTQSHGLRFGKLTRTLQIKLVASRGGRIALHLLVALKTGHLLWHWHGIVRELARV
jgi:hypothetical protein